MISAAMAYIGITLITIGAFLVFLPAGLVAAGIGLIAAAYVRRYLEAGREITEPPRR